MRKHMLKALPVLVALGVGVTIPAAGATTIPAAGATMPQQGLIDLGNNPYNWSVTAPQYRAVILNDWKGSWAAQIRAAGSQAYVYKDLTSTRETDCGSNPGGGAPCIVNGTFCPPGVHDAPFYAGGMGFCWAWRYHRNWFLRDSQGHLLTEAGFPTQYVMDFGSPGYQWTWLKVVRADALAQGWKGIFADNALDNNSYGTPAKYPTTESVQVAQLAMLKVVGPELRKAGIAFVPNLGFTNLYPGLWTAWMPFVSGFQNQHNVGNVGQQKYFCRAWHRTCFFNQINNTTFTYLQG